MKHPPEQEESQTASQGNPPRLRISPKCFSDRLARIEATIEHHVSHRSLWGGVGTIVAALGLIAFFGKGYLEEERQLLRRDFEISLREALAEQNKSFDERISAMQTSLTTSLFDQSKFLLDVSSWGLLPHDFKKLPVVKDPVHWGNVMESFFDKAVSEGAVQVYSPDEIYVRKNGEFAPLFPNLPEPE